MMYAYIPSNWGPALAVGKDAVDLTSSIYGYCGMEKLYTSLSDLTSQQGFFQMVGRSATMAVFEFSPHWIYGRDAEMNGFCRGYHLAKIISTVLNFNIY